MHDSQNISCQTPPETLIPFQDGTIIGTFVKRVKRFSVLLNRPDGELVWIHTNNTGSMLGLTRPGIPVLASRSANPLRKLHFTQEAVWCGQISNGFPVEGKGFWTGVNTNTPNRMLEKAFLAGKLPFAQGYTNIRREVRKGASRLDACLTGESKPPLWVECKNVTMVEDNIALFPDAVSARGQKHLRELMDIAISGDRAAMFYLVQRADGRCFGPADIIDREYASLFFKAQEQGVEIYAYRATVTPSGISLSENIPLLQQRPAEV